MDQLKENLEKVKPYAFWIVCTVILLMTVGTWYMATGTLHQQKEEYESKIKGADQTLTGLAGKAGDHPNEATATGMDKLIQAYGREIASGWITQYERQKDVLVWPASFDQDFQDAVKDKRPIEKVPVLTPVNLTIPDSLRRRYRDFIEDELPKLAVTIGSKWHARRDGTTETPLNTRIGADGRPEGEVDNSLVLWVAENQRDILMSHFGFTAMEDDPSTLDVLYAQEDLWVLQNLMNIIKKTNERAEARHDAAVKQIEFVRIGKAALGNAGQVMLLGTGTGTGSVPGSIEGAQVPQNPGAPADPAAPQTSAAPVPGSPAVIVPPPSPTTDVNFNPKDPANWRYVDQNNFPLAGFQLRTALTAPTPENALLTVAKRMPVRLRLEINQRQLNKLLTEFGNAALPVEIRQIRINRDPAAPGSFEGFFSGAGGGMGPTAGPSQGSRGGGEGFTGGGPGGPSRFPGGNEGFGGFTQNPGVSGSGGSGSLTRDATVDTNLIQVELYGIVYLYNPVNHALLGLAPSGGTAVTTPPPVSNSGG